jgi:hypothetical protein
LEQVEERIPRINAEQRKNDDIVMANEAEAFKLDSVTLR